MTRVIHTGDTHIGYQQYHQPERRHDFLDAFGQVIDDAIDDEVDAVVHAGDLFHDRQPGLQDILGTLSRLRPLAAADIPFLAVVGNHESKRDVQWLDLFESLGLAVRIGRTPHVVGDTAFYGMDFVPRAQRAALEYDFEPHTAEHAVLVTHGLFEPFEYGDWATEQVLQESTVSFDAMLLGDNHTPDRTEIDGTVVTYCGSTERASASETDERGYNIVSFSEESDSHQVHISRRGLETREFVFIDLELKSGEGIERITERVGQHDLTDSVVVVTIDGEGDPVAPASVESFIDEQGALVARVTDRRERDDEEEIEANFADPDEAVRERVRDLGLSVAAQGIDETVRTNTIADANVADEVQRRVQDLIDDADAFAVDTDAQAKRENGDANDGAAVSESTEEEADDGETAADGGAEQSTMGEYQ
ncbi:DNA double-strand break repair protein Mre11 [Halocatena marina]|uniref:DNA double-strand break repair protein Mre11 n=1 Tax=Halocatena marina TaxID=2934937 RepID=UPI0020104670|nr:DNA double-strand break repair protein Mre11 [Halocatena marina]